MDKKDERGSAKGNRVVRELVREDVEKSTRKDKHVYHRFDAPDAKRNRANPKHI